ncbi:hypothetical protein SHIRM173S_10697 [Streptomyces hirsutus]
MTTTPCGLPVEPEVNCRYATESRSSTGSGRPAPPDTASAARHGTEPWPCRASSRDTSGASAASVSATRGDVSRTMPATRSS